MRTPVYILHSCKNNDRLYVVGNYHIGGLIMALQIKTIRGRKYVYDVKSFWDKQAKKFRKRTTYMGVCINEKTKEYAPKVARVSKINTERKGIVSFGDSNLLNECLKQSK